MFESALASAIIVLLWWKEEEWKSEIDNLPILAICHFGTLVTCPAKLTVLLLMEGLDND